MAAVERQPQEDLNSVLVYDSSKTSIPSTTLLESTNSGAQQRQSLPEKPAEKDPNLVTFDGPDDPDNPKNWPASRKWAATLIVSSFTFISPVSSSILAPSLSAISEEFSISEDVQKVMLLSIFVLAYAIGPLLVGPLSEIYGRVIVLQLANVFYLAWNTGCGFAQSTGQLLAIRFLSGLGGAAPQAIGGGVLSDIWEAEERGKAMSIYSLAPFLGPAIGPLVGGFITEYANWRWCFYATSIADFLIQLLSVFYLQETYVPLLLERRAAKLRKETGNHELRVDAAFAKSPGKVLAAAMTRPFRLILTQPIVQWLAAYMAYLYGLTYLVLSTFPTLWTETYGMSVSIGGLNYIALGLGLYAGTQFCARVNNPLYQYMKERFGDGITGRPEFRIPLMIPGSLFVPVGLFWYGWSAEAKLHWIMPDIGVFIFSMGTIVCFQCIQTYIVDVYTRYVASAIAAAMVLRSLCGFIFPLWAPYMYDALGNGWGNSLLAFIGMAIGVPAPLLLWKFGPALRARSKFAAG